LSINKKINEIEENTEQLRGFYYVPDGRIVLREKDYHWLINEIKSIGKYYNLSNDYSGGHYQ